MKTLTKIVSALALATTLAGCGKWEDTVTITGEQSPQWYQLVNQDGDVTTWGLDIDGDKTIDEALTLRGVYGRNMGPMFAAATINDHQLSDKITHKVVPEFKEKSYMKTKNTQEMTPEERTALTTAYKLVQ